jgi:Flp pilus assembly protein TadD
MQHTTEVVEDVSAVGLAALVDPALDRPISPGSDKPIGRARTLCELGRFAEAVPAVAAVIAAAPRDADAWCLMAEAQLGSERPAAALEAARAAAKIDPARAEPHRLASLALARLGREDESADSALQATQCEPGSWQAQARLAHALTTFRNRLGEARRAAERALALNSDDPGPHMAVGAVALAAGRRAEAAAAFCAALSVDPQCSEAHNQLAVVQDLGPRRGLGSAWSRLTARAPGRKHTQGTADSP